MITRSYSREVLAEIPNNKRQKKWDTLYSGDLNRLPWIHNPYPKDLFKNFVTKLGASTTILDYGCGNGRYYETLNKYGGEVTCVDISAKALNLCKTKHPKAITVCSDNPSVLADSYFVGVFCWGVLHHINPDDRFMFWQEMYRIVPKGGFILLGGWSKEDCEHKNMDRISSITSEPTWNIDIDTIELSGEAGLSIIEKDTYVFKEFFTNKIREFSFYLLQK